MDTNGATLILEGGGLRGIYTSGVLRRFMDEGIRFSAVYGVSMGACNGANYVAGQPERNRIVNIRFVDDRRYLSYLRLAGGGELFGMDFIFDEIPRSIVPFDLEAFSGSTVRFWMAVTDCQSGEPVYYEKTGLGAHALTVMRASCALPFIARPVAFDGRLLMDGGLADPVPIARSLSDGNRRNVLVLTRPRGYRKKPSAIARLARFRYPKLTGLSRVMAERHRRYNETMDLVDRLEAAGEAFVIRPRTAIDVGRAERDKDKLYAGYDLGYAEAQAVDGALGRFLES